MIRLLGDGCLPWRHDWGYWYYPFLSVIRQRTCQKCEKTQYRH